MNDGIVRVSRTIEAPADKLFTLLANSANHPLIDGSGMLRETPPGVALSGVGDVFSMKMHNPEMGDYEMDNHVIEYEPNRRIGWEPALKASPRPQDQAGVGKSARQRWTFELTPVAPGSTLVTEIFDCGRSPEWLRKAVKDGARWVSSMQASLENLDALSRR